MGTKTYANIAQQVNQPSQDSTSIDKYQKLIEKLINLKANEWLTFQETLKPLKKQKKSDKGQRYNLQTLTNIYKWK